MSFTTAWPSRRRPSGARPIYGCGDSDFAWARTSGDFDSTPASRSPNSARVTGIHRSHLARIEAGIASPSLDVLLAIGVALGADLSLRYFAGAGPRLVDRFQAPMMEYFLRKLDPRWSVRLEVPVVTPARGVVDAALVDRSSPVALAAEFQSEMHGSSSRSVGTRTRPTLWPTAWPRKPRVPRPPSRGSSSCAPRRRRGRSPAGTRGRYTPHTRRERVMWSRR